MISDNDGWIVGAGTILRWNGINWQTAANLVPACGLSSIAMISVTDGWAVSDSCGYYYRWNGMTWTKVNSPTVPELAWPLYSISIISTTDGWAAGWGTVVRWNGTTWAEVFSGATGYIHRAVAMSSAANGWLVEERYIRPFPPIAEFWIYRWNGSTWITIGQTAYPMNAITTISDTDAWMVGEMGTILHWDGSAWNSIDSPTSASLHAISMVSPTDGWIVGQNGTMLHWDGGAWTAANSPTSTTLRSVWMVSSTYGWAVGDNGTILRYGTFFKTYLPVIFQ